MHNADLGRQSNLLQKILHDRFKKHFITKLVRHALSHWSLIWTTSQLGRVACIHVLLGHVKSTLDLNLLSVTPDCLLRTPDLSLIHI